jgi:SAM-dependent methyltransferase
MKERDTASPPQIFDRQLYGMRRARAERLGQSEFLLPEIAAHLAERVSAVNRRFERGLDLSSREEGYEQLRGAAANWTRAKLYRSPDAIVADEEALPFAPESFDLIVSVLSLHAVNDLPGALIQIRRALRPDGLFLAALFAGDTLIELRDAFAQAEDEVLGGASPRVAPFADVRDLGGLLQRAGLSLPVSDVERTTVRYRSFDTLVGDLRGLGETNALAQRSQKFLRRDVLVAAMAHYSAAHAEPDGRLRATFDIAYLTGWAPHESQPKPLKPGTARSRLADALRRG